jgi:hypothetical protein
MAVSPKSGKNHMVMLAPDGTTAASPLSMTTQFTISGKANRTEVTYARAGNRVYIQDYPDAQGTLKGYYSEQEDTIYKAAAYCSTTPGGVVAYFYPDYTANYQYYWYGSVIVDADLDVPMGPVAYSATWAAAGTITHHVL